MNRRQIFPVLMVLISLFLTQHLQARHIIGGVMTYECLGNDNYEFTLRVYRDCNCTDCALLDQVAEIGIYQCNGPNDCPNQQQNTPYASLSVPLTSESFVEEPDYPCLIPPNVCGQEGIYRFTLNLPQSNLSYFVTYQRCCRNVTISNIVNPDGTGASFFIELTPSAQSLCNSSPFFATYPPIIICNNAPINYDHSAIDPDGDLLIYEFCAPLKGGGSILTEPAYSSCDGAKPNPACPPPYNPVSFLAPSYSASAPMGGNPVVSIDSQTGLITGTPLFQGQYVVGVCVSEYRNGALLSKVVRDFQFNVASCDPTVVADVREDFQISDQEFVINACGETDVFFENQSYQQSFIDNFRWSFDVGAAQNVESTEWSPTITFPGIGTYEGNLFLNENTDCGDTAKIFVNVYPAIDADFSFVYDTCVAGAVAFTDLSATGACCLTAWDWEFGDGNESSVPNPEHTYHSPGDIPVKLTVTDTNSCVDELTKIVNYFPVPNLIVIAPSAEIACEPAEIFFDNLSFPIDTTYDILWEFGDGGTSSEISPFYIYDTPGTYTVSVDITSPIGCQTDTTFQSLITVLASPEAGFSFMPDQLSSLKPEVQFTDESLRAFSWQWDFGDGQGSNARSPYYIYPDTGMFVVQQVVIHQSGCTDTLLAAIDIVPDIRYFLPNAFTPNGDGTNDTYAGIGIFKGISAFKMSIWNRWGEPMFEAQTPNEAWNGKKNNVGNDQPSGVYLVMVQFKNPRGEAIEMKSYATLIR